MPALSVHSTKELQLLDDFVLQTQYWCLSPDPTLFSHLSQFWNLLEQRITVLWPFDPG